MSSVSHATTIRSLTIALLTVAVGCDVRVANIRPVGSTPVQGPLTHEDLDATLWMRSSAEYAVITQMIYEAAWRHVEAGLCDDNYTAWPPPGITRATTAEDDTARSNGQPLPPAVILDVDETVLDNSAFQVQQILANGDYRPDAWHAFCQRAESLAVPGAVQFITRCRKAGIEVFFVTNRDVAERQATCRNLSKLEMLPAAEQQHLLCKGERPKWTSDKESRRQQIAEAHRILALIGDDLNDFVFVGYKPTASERRRLATEYTKMWGNGWFMLPNADYGGWERAIYDWNDALPRPQKLQRKLEALR